MDHVARPVTMTVEQAGRLLGISRGAAYRAAANGQLPTLRVGRRLVVPTARLYHLLGLPTQTATTPANGDTTTSDTGDDTGDGDADGGDPAR